MAWVGRLDLARNNLSLLDRVFYSALGRICPFSTKERCWSVSSLGRCRNSRGQLTLGYLRPDGYRRVCVSGHMFPVHRMVAMTFLGPPVDSSAWQVHHRDGDRSNNRLDNLMYVTNSKNVQSSFCNPSRRNASASISKPVIWRNLAKSHEWNTCPSIITAAKVLGLSQSTVVRCCLEGIPTGDFQIQFAPPAEPDCLPGEMWLPMKNPLTGHAVNGRQVSSFGRIKSSHGLVTRGRALAHGYFNTDLRQYSQCRKVMVHRLVAYAFLGPPPSPGHTQVNHKDSNPRNNCLENLEYVTPSENMAHFHANRTVPWGGARPVPVLSRLHGSGDEWTTFSSMSHAAKALGLDCGQVSRCARGLQKRAGSYEFCLAEPPEGSQSPGEEWRVVDLEGLLQEKASRTR